ncbi:MAG: MFS transporter, partial [Deltaproteobacteria bacterium]|nr:MFS transporter [Deltaproteobacteria bacterium]
MTRFKHTHRDVKLIMVSRGVRAFAFSYLNVVFSIYLDSLGYSTVMIGMVHSVAYISGALLTALWGVLSDHYGRTKILMLLAVLTIVSNTIFIFFSQLVFILLAVVIANVGSGGSAGGGQGGGPFNPVEQALLAEKCNPENRNQIFSTNSFVGSVMGSLGALMSGLPQHLQQNRGWEPVLSYKPLFLLTILFTVGLLFVYRAIAEEHRPRQRERKISRQSGMFVTKMSLLGVLDNMGAGLIGPLVSYWFFLRFGVELKSLGLMFFLSYIFAALSFLAAPVIARRIGVVRTMVFSHAIASGLNLFIAFAPTFFLAGLVLVVRSFLAYMDNPLRESFTMAMVKSEERGSAAGMTNLARIVPFGVSPTISAYLMQ